jgi:Uma2 family endonuclease
MSASVTTTETLLTVEEFMLRPEREDGALEELVDGKVIVIPRPTEDHSILCLRIAALIQEFAEPRKLGLVSCNDSATILNQHNVREPNVAFYSISQVPPMYVGFYYFEVVPELIVVVISPSDSASYVHEKVVQFLKAGVRLIWVLYPMDRDVVVYHSLDRVQHLTEKHTLDGGSVLPGFSCRIAELFGEIRS